MKKEKEKFYICPFCKQKQTSVITWQTKSVAYEYDLKTQEREEVDERAEKTDIEYTCPDCGEELNFNIVAKFFI